MEDELLARRRLQRLLSKHVHVRVLGEALNVEEAKRLLRAHAPIDAVFLDIEMPGGSSGWKLAKQISKDVDIVFVTAYPKYAVPAFAIDAVDYLLKPVSEERVDRCVERLTDRKQNRRADRAEAPRGGSKICARHGDKIRFFSPREVRCLLSAGDYVHFVQDGQDYLVDGTLAAFADRLAGDGFMRVHRTAIVNLAHVVALASSEKGMGLELDDGRIVPISRRSLADIKKRLGLP